MGPQSGCHDHRRVECDRIGEVAAILDHLDHERLSRRRVEGADHALEHLQRKQLWNGDDERLSYARGVLPAHNVHGS
jgi:hypothetical protein